MCRTFHLHLCIMGATGTGGVPVAPAFPRMLLTVARIPGNDPAGGLVHQGGAFPFLNICGADVVYWAIAHPPGRSACAHPEHLAPSLRGDNRQPAFMV